MRIDVGQPGVECAGGVIRIDAQGVMTLSYPGVPDVIEPSTDLASDGAVELWCGDSSAYVVGIKSPRVWFARPSAGELRAVGQLERLDLHGGYDPGGLHRVEFVGLEDGDVLLVHELGAARFGPGGDTRWSRSHDQLAAHRTRISGGVVWLQGDYGEFGFRLDDGAEVVGE